MTHTLPNPETRMETFKVDQGGKRYEVEFFCAKPIQVRVRMQRTRYGATYRCLWYGGHKGESGRAATGRAAEVIAYVTDPARAAANHARVRDPATIKAENEAYADDFRRRHEASKAREAREKRLAEAAPALLAAAKKAAAIMAVDREGRARRGEEDTIGASVLALLQAAIDQAEGEG